jgi:hypothetical protein
MNVTTDMYVLNLYSDIIRKEFPNEINFGISFLADSEDYADSIEPIEMNIGIVVGPEHSQIKINSHFDYDDNILDSNILSEVNRCYIKGIKFLKIITPLFIGDSHDIILAPNNQIKDIILAVKQVKDYKINTAIHAPLIDLPLDMLKRDILDFLTNEDFASFCKKYSIKQKRGFIFCGAPGNGKTLSLAWLKSQALQLGLEFRAYKSAKDYMENSDSDSQNKRILVFEEFDTYLQERKRNVDDDSEQTNSNTVMGSLLQVLDGIEDTANAVFIFTTNFISTFDSAIMRPGRIDKVITFESPTKESQLKFLVTYLSEYIVQKDIIEYLGQKNIQVSFAMLKAIVDNIRIREFWLLQEGVIIPQLEFTEIVEIIDNVLSNSNKGKEVMNTEESIL